MRHTREQYEAGIRAMRESGLTIRESMFAGTPECIGPYWYATGEVRVSPEGALHTVAGDLAVLSRKIDAYSVQHNHPDGSVTLQLSVSRLAEADELATEAA